LFASIIPNKTSVFVENRPVTRDQFLRMKEEQSAATGAGSVGPSTAPAGQPMPLGGENMGSSTLTTSARLVLNGNDPVHLPAGQPWQDNLGAVFTHEDQPERIYSTTTVASQEKGSAAASTALP
jgi:hypothetical protein